jgi:predicted Zn-dependent peptidase
MKRTQITHLDNGLRIVSESLPQVESVAIGLWIRAGLESEPDSLVGISHYLEHMLFKGTSRRNARQISAEIDNVGGHLNGYTDREYTSLYVHLAGEHLSLAVDLIFDMALQSVIAADEVEKEREVILQEDLRIEDNPEEQVHDLAVQAAWPDHPLGRILQGTVKSIGAVQRRDLLDYYHACYRPERILVAAAGALKHEQLVELVEQAAGKLTVGRAESSPPPPTFHSSQQSINRAVEQVQLCLALPGCSQTDKRRYAFSLYDLLLGASTSSRLFQEIRENRGLAYSIASYPLACRKAGLLLIHAGAGSKSVEQVLELIRLELEKLKTAGVTEEELRWTKEHVKGQIALARESTAYRMQRLAHSLLYEGRVIPHRELLSQFEKITAKDLHEVAEYVCSAEPTVITLGPMK